jgi:hypothetical protein
MQHPVGSAAGACDSGREVRTEGQQEWGAATEADAGAANHPSTARAIFRLTTQQAKAWLPKKDRARSRENALAKG